MNEDASQSEVDAAGAVSAPLRAVPSLWLSLLPGFFAYVTVVAIARLLLPARLDTVRHISNIGGADSAAYALQARSQVEGRGLTVPYVTNYMYVYPAGVKRQDDQWPPLLSFVESLAFRIQGIQTNIPAMTTVVIGTLLLPLCFCALVHATTGRAWFGLLAALTLYWSDETMRESRAAMSDQLLTAVLCLFVAALLFSRRHRAWLLLCGATLALAWYGKGSQIMLFGFLLGGTLLLHGFPTLLRWEFLGAVLLALLLLFPRLHSNARNFGNPLHSTQAPVSAYYGLTDHDPLYFLIGFYSIYWGHDLPGAKDRFKHPYLHARSMRRNTERFVRPYLLGLESKNVSDWSALGAWPLRLAEALHDSRRVRPLTMILSELHGNVLPPTRWSRPWMTRFHLLGALWGLLAMVLMPVVWLWRIIRRHRLPPGKDSVLLATGLLATFVLLQALFVIVLWEALPRLTYPAVIPGWALGWCLFSLLLGGVMRLGRRIVRRPAPGWMRPVLAGLFCTALGVVVALHAGKLHAHQVAALESPPPTTPASPPFKELVDRLTTSFPEDAVIMCNHRKVVLWFAPRSYRSCGLPYAPPADMLAVARYYGVTHIIRDWPSWRVYSDHAMRMMFHSHPDAFELVVSRPFPVYRIHWDRVPEGLVTPLDKLKPCWNPAMDMHQWEQWLKRSSERPREPRAYHSPLAARTRHGKIRSRGVSDNPF